MLRLLSLLALLAACNDGRLDLGDGDVDSDVVDTGDVDDTDDTDVTDTEDTGPFGPPPYGCGLLENGDAEYGDTTGWTLELGDLQAAGPGDGLLIPIQGDFQFFAGQTERSTASQAVDLEPWADDIDSGLVFAHLHAEVRDWSGDDEPSLSIEALDEAGVALGQVGGGPWRRDLWRDRHVHLGLPTGSRQVVIRLDSVRREGTDNDGYFDVVDLCVDTEPPPDMTDLRRGPRLNWVTSEAISVLWETEGDVLGAVEYGETGDLGQEVVEAGADDHHEVRLTGLKPDTVYLYRVRSEATVSETFSFRTAPELAVPFSFVVWGDNQDGPGTFEQIVDQMEILAPDFAVATGDVVQSGTEGNWQDELLGPIRDLALDTPFLVAGGNHERYSDGGASLFDLHLAQPGDEHCFGWTYANVFFLFIDTEQDFGPGSAQHTCIEGALASSEFAAADIQMALFHYPPRIEYWTWWFYDGPTAYDGDDDVRSILEPMFDTAGVDIVFNGHNHLYAYTPPDVYSQPAWVTTGGGGGGIDTDGWGTANWSGITETIHEHHFLWIQVDGSRLDASVLSPDGVELHSFYLYGT